MKKRPYQKNFRVAYHDSTRNLLITVPDIVKWPSDRAWVWLRDNHTVVMSIDKPTCAKDAAEVRLSRQKNLPGCRYFYLGPVTHGLGEPFRVKPTQYERLDESDSLRFGIKIPLEEERAAPKGTVRAKVVETVDLIPVDIEPETEKVRIEGFGSSWRFELTIEQTLELTAYANRLANPEA